MKDVYIKNRRRDILRLLFGEADYRLSAANIKTLLKARFAYSVNIDEIKDDFRFLEGEKLITKINNEPLIIELTEIGGEVVEGDRVIEGVARKALRS